MERERERAKELRSRATAGLLLGLNRYALENRLISESLFHQIEISIRTEYSRFWEEKAKK